MPVLPLDHIEPFAAVFGVMLYPRPREAARAKAFASQYLARPIKAFIEAGGDLSTHQWGQLATSAGEVLVDLDRRWYAGTMVGELFKTYFCLAMDAVYEDRASWENAGQLIEKLAVKQDVASRETGKAAQFQSVSRSSIMQAKAEFISVAHLWGALAVRGKHPRNAFQQFPEVQYTYVDDFNSFLTEAEILRNWGQSWRQKSATAKPPLPSDVWRIPDNWRPPVRQAGWPMTGVIPHMTIADLDRLLPEKGKRGRPRKLA